MDTYSEAQRTEDEGDFEGFPMPSAEEFEAMCDKDDADVAAGLVYEAAPILAHARALAAQIRSERIARESAQSSET